MQRIFRSRSERMLFGVAGGLAKSLNVDPVIVRTAFVLSIFIGGTGLLAYIVLAVVMPQEPFHIPGFNDMHNTMEYGAESAPVREDRRKYLSMVLGGALVLMGGLSLADLYLPDLDTSFLWPLIMIGIGTVLLVRAISPVLPPLGHHDTAEGA